MPATKRNQLFGRGSMPSNAIQEAGRLADAANDSNCQRRTRRLEGWSGTRTERYCASVLRHPMNKPETARVRARRVSRAWSMLRSQSTPYGYTSKLKPYGYTLTL